MTYKLVHFVLFFNTIFGDGDVGAGGGAASHYGSGSDQMMRLLAAPALQHWVQYETQCNENPSAPAQTSAG
jgi:hypothetical protein